MTFTLKYKGRYYEKDIPSYCCRFYSQPAFCSTNYRHEDNFAQAYTNMRLGVVVEKAGGINTFFEMPVPEQCSRRAVRCTNESRHFLFRFVIDMSNDDVYVTVPETDQYVSLQMSMKPLRHNQ